LLEFALAAVIDGGPHEGAAGWATLLSALEHMFDSYGRLVFMTEPVEANCLVCPAVVAFDTQPGYTTCEGCGAKLYLTSSGQVGLFPREGWKPGGFGRERRKRA
jgi:hypothetical protein